jgi:hypothetical protein
VENSRLRKRSPTSVNVTVGKRSREYLTEREVERLIEAAKQNRSGRAGHCASSCAKHQRHPTSSCRNVAHLFPQPDISAWWPGRAGQRNSAFSFVPTCCGTPAGSSSPTTATTLAPSALTPNRFKNFWKD